MARQHRDIKSANKGTVEIVGMFFPNNTSAVSNSSNKGRGFTVARGAQGSFTITLTDRYSSLVSAWAQVGLSSAADMATQFGAVTVSRSAANTVVIRTQAANTATDIAANANNRIMFGLILQHEQAA